MKEDLVNQFALEKRRILLRVSFTRIWLASLALLGILLTACAPADVSGKTSQDVISTAQAMTSEYQTQTAQPTIILTESPTPTETLEVEPRVPPLTKDEIFSENDMKGWEASGDGGYFSSQPELEDSGQYVYMDFSYQGQIRIGESPDLDENSWGLFYIRERKTQSGGIIPVTMLTFAIYVQLFEYDREAEVVWGDFKPGTVFFVSKEVLFQYATPQMSEEEFKKLFLPIEDPRFTCTEVDMVYDRKGNLKQTPGIIFEYTG